MKFSTRSLINFWHYCTASGKGEVTDSNGRQIKLSPEFVCPINCINYGMEMVIDNI